MLIPFETEKTKYYYKVRKIERVVSLLGILIPMLIALKHCIDHSHKVASEYHIRGVKPSPYFSGLKIDLEDGQLGDFLSNLPLLCVVAISYVLLKRVVRSYRDNPQDVLIFYVVFGIGFAGYLHGGGILYILGMIVANYYYTLNFSGTRYFSPVLWASNLGFLILAEYYNGFKFQWFSSSLGFLDTIPYELKWHRVSNLYMLKYISYAMDFHWQRLRVPVECFDKHIIKCEECSKEVRCLRYRTEMHAQNYSLLGFIAYALYVPLYLAGPTISYNAFISQVEKPQQTYPSRRLFLYFLRFLVMVATLLFFIHNLFFPGIAANRHNRYIWEQFTAYEMGTASFFILKWIWLKFTVIWRFFRIWALLDGIESPENMGRCMSNNYCFEGFWRQWHRAFNQWLIRYLFVPLGGSKYKIFNIWVVFGFVALWHDLSMNLIAWGWGMCLVIMPEVAMKSYFKQKSMTPFRQTLTYSWGCAFAGGFCIILMCIANLVGFSFGLTGLNIVASELASFEGAKLMVFTLLALTSGAHFMFNFREYEEEVGINKRGY